MTSLTHYYDVTNQSFYYDATNPSAMPSPLPPSFNALLAAARTEREMSRVVDALAATEEARLRLEKRETVLLAEVIWG